MIEMPSVSERRLAVGTCAILALASLPGLLSGASELTTILATSMPQRFHLVVSILLCFGAASTWALNRRKGKAPTDAFEAIVEHAASQFPFVICEPDTRLLPNAREWLEERLGHSGPFDHDAVAMALSSQLTSKWTGLDGEPRHRAALLILFAMHAADPLGDYIGFRDKLAAATFPSQLEFTLASFDVTTEMLEKTREGTDLRAWIDAVSVGYAWSETVSMACLSAARRNRSLPESEFGWLLAADRPLAMALNSTGRPSFPVEGLGAATHWCGEVRSGFSIPEPSVEPAVRAVLERLKWESQCEDSKK